MIKRLLEGFEDTLRIDEMNILLNYNTTRLSKNRHAETCTCPSIYNYLVCLV